MRFRTKNIILLSITIVLAFIASSCTNHAPGVIKTTIKGSFPAFKGKSVSISAFDINSSTPIDTVKISDDGSFKFNIKRNGPGFYLVKVDNKNYLTLILDKEKKVEVASEGNSLRKGYTVKGSPDSELYRDFEMFLEVNRNKVDSLSRTYNDFQRSSSFKTIKNRLDEKYMEIFENQRQYSINFIENHCSSLASLLVINRRFGERKILDDEADYTYFVMIDSCLSAIYPDNKQLAEHKHKLETINEHRKILDMTEKRLAAGNKIPDISLKNPEDKDIHLYSFQGKPVVLYFWASWDKNSRNANKVLKAIVDKAGKNKLSVFAVGMESYKDMWKEAIKADGLESWIHGTEYLNVSSSAKTLFNLPDRFPYFILLDKELKIIYRGESFDLLSAEIGKVLQ
jgi:hypothetical protein